MDRQAKTGQDGLVEGLSALGRVMVAITARTLSSVETEVTLAQYRAIVVLASQGPQRSVDLAVALGVHPSTVTRTCDRLVRRLIERRPVSSDRRMSRLVLTARGKQLIGEVARRRSAQIRAVLDAASIDDRMPLLELVHAFVTASGELSERQWWRRWARSTEPG